uniref:Uncharacterized protein n=1 Tax=Anguilla anguilla TaxID=7936 RepID=A0A0E9XMB2_ANGAN
MCYDSGDLVMLWEMQQSCAVGPQICHTWVFKFVIT